MTKRVWVNVRESMTLAKFFQPICYTVRVHWFSVILRKQEPLILIVLPQTEPLLCLPYSVLL